MKISTKGRYALRMMYEVYISTQSPVSLNEISEKQHISKKYLEQIVPMLTKAKLLKAVRGNKGGYKPVISASELSVAQVLQATEGSTAPVACLETAVNDCPYASECTTLFVWKGLFDVIENYLNSVSIQDIIDKNIREPLIN